MNTHRKLGIKRSIHCDDLSSIVGLDQHAGAGSDAPLNSSSLHKRVKRQRAISTDSSSSSSCSPVCCFWEEEKAIMLPPLPLEPKFLPAAGAAAASSNDDSSTPPQQLPKAPSSSVARLISPATSHVAVVAPEAAALGDESISLPHFPSLSSRSRGESCDFPATAALERFVLRQRRDEPAVDDGLGGVFSPSFEVMSDEESFRLWPKTEREGLPSPRHIEEFPWNTRTVSMASSRKSSTVSVMESSTPWPSIPFNIKAQKASPSSFLSMDPSSKLRPKISHRAVPTVNQITEALARIDC
mmetsp:Transcript_34104/g.82465  ORF Transcript_34104/g.82465 Transcript_34104/m.82465 type:complete len:299 (+) Transcript_34104:338-1234(+)